MANKNGGFVIGTGDLSELALGWATYNGDHMSMYGVNAGVPKTLVRHHCAATWPTLAATTTLRGRAAWTFWTRPSAPSCCPPPRTATIAQKTEDLVGPYELHDFFLYYAAALRASARQRSTGWRRTAFDGRYERGRPADVAARISTAASSPSSSSAAVCPTARRSARSRCRPAATGACPATPAIRCGWQN